MTKSQGRLSTYLPCTAVRCGYVPLYGHDGVKRRCRKHALAGDTRVYNKRPIYVCRAPNCRIIAYYGPVFAGRARRLFCREHKRQGHAYAMTRACWCGAVAQWSATGCKLERCSAHRLAGDMRQASRTCSVEACISPVKTGSSRCKVHQ